MTDAELGAALRRAGLTVRAVEVAWGTSSFARLPQPPAPAPAGSAPRRFPTPTAAVLGLLIAGAEVALADAERGLGAPVLAALVERGLVTVDGDRVRAAVSIIPVGPSLVVCDRDARPDDSSQHLIECLPRGRAARWLDVGTGCAIAPLARPERGAAIVAADVDPRAVARARLGIRLSGVRHVELIEADLTAGAGADFDLVTFNLPIPAEAGLTTAADPGFRHAPPGADLLARFVAEIPPRLAHGTRSASRAAATVVVHTWFGPPAAAVVDALPGAVVVVTYTPAGAAPFAVVRWRPHAAAARGRAHRDLTADAPHLTWADLESVATH